MVHGPGRTFKNKKVCMEEHGQEGAINTCPRAPPAFQPCMGITLPPTCCDIICDAVLRSRVTIRTPHLGFLGTPPCQAAQPASANSLEPLTASDHSTACSLQAL